MKYTDIILSVLVNSIQIIEKQVEEQNKLIENQDKKLNHSISKSIGLRKLFNKTID